MCVLPGRARGAPTQAGRRRLHRVARRQDGRGGGGASGRRPASGRILIYVDGLAAKHDELERAAAALEAAKSQLAALGPVTLLVADTLIEPWIEDSTDLDELQSSFAELAEATFEAP
jgi:hypothetical protein